MLKHIMEVKGKIPIKMLKAGQLTSNHFDENLDFVYRDRDAFFKKEVARVLHDLRPSRNLTDALLERQHWLKGTSAGMCHSQQGVVSALIVEVDLPQSSGVFRGRGCCLCIRSSSGSSSDPARRM